MKSKLRYSLDTLWAYQIGYHLLRAYPRFIGEFFGWAVSTATYLFSTRIRRGLKENLQVVKGKEHQSGDALELLNNYGSYLCDFFSLPLHRATDTLAARFHQPLDFSPIENILKRGRGVILYSIHLGNWEGAAHLIKQQGYPVNFFVYHDPSEKLDRQLAEYRQSRGLKLRAINRSQSSLKAVLRALAANEVVGILGDRDTLGTGTLVKFFDREVRLPYGPVGLARVSGAPILPAFVPRQDDRYRLIFETPLEPPSHKGDAEEDLGRQLIGLMEKYIRAYPTQWYNFFSVFGNDEAKS